MYVDQSLPILYRDEQLVAVNKPSGLLVHRSPIDRHETRFALQLVRDAIGQRVYPVHRLDKPTSGLLLFALSPEVARVVSDQFAAGQVFKRYLAVVRDQTDPGKAGSAALVTGEGGGCDWNWERRSPLPPALPPLCQQLLSPLLTPPCSYLHRTSPAATVLGH